eukprot:4031789-Amphidinium_carterae.2
MYHCSSCPKLLPTHCKLLKLERQFAASLLCTHEHIIESCASVVRFQKVVTSHKSDAVFPRHLSMIRKRDVSYVVQQSCFLSGIFCHPLALSRKYGAKFVAMLNEMAGTLASVQCHRN